MVNISKIEKDIQVAEERLKKLKQERQVAEQKLFSEIGKIYCQIQRQSDKNLTPELIKTNLKNELNQIKDNLKKTQQPDTDGL